MKIINKLKKRKVIKTVKIISTVGNYQNMDLRHISNAGESLDYFDGEI